MCSCLILIAVNVSDQLTGRNMDPSCCLVTLFAETHQNGAFQSDSGTGKQLEKSSSKKMKLE